MPKSPNPFLNLPEDKLAMVREYFLKSEFAGQMDFERYLAWLHEDDLIPEDVFAVIEHENTEPKIVEVMRNPPKSEFCAAGNAQRINFSRLLV